MILEIKMIETEQIILTRKGDRLSFDLERIRIETEQLTLERIMRRQSMYFNTNKG